MLDTELLERVLAAALERGGEFAEIFVEDSSSLGLSLEDNKIERVTSGHDRGAGVRVVVGDATGYAYSDDVSEERLLDAARTARAIATGGGATRAVNLSPVSPAYQHEIRRDPRDANEHEKADLVRRVNEAARASGAEVRQVSARYGEWRQRVRIANSEGMLIGDERSQIQLATSVTTLRDGRLQTANRARGGQRGLEIFDGDVPEALGREAAQVALLLLDADPAPAGRMPVVVTRGWGAVLFHEAVGHGLEADHVVHNSSVYAGKMGESVANSIVTLVDDATIPGHRGSFRFDDEGSLAQRTVLVDGGVLVGYLTDRKSAASLNLGRSGNGRRESFQHLPVPRMTNLCIQPGTMTPDELIAGTTSGLYVASIGGGMVEPARGEFVFSVTEAYLIENGKLGAPVRGATLAGDSFRVLADIDAVASDFALDPGMGNCGKSGQWVPVGVGQPTLRVREMLVGGTG